MTYVYLRKQSESKLSNNISNEKTDTSLMQGLTKSNYF